MVLLWTELRKLEKNYACIKKKSMIYCPCVPCMSRKAEARVFMRNACLFPVDEMEKGRKKWDKLR